MTHQINLYQAVLLTLAHFSHCTGYCA